MMEPMSQCALCGAVLSEADQACGLCGGSPMVPPGRDGALPGAGPSKLVMALGGALLVSAGFLGGVLLTRSSTTSAPTDDGRDGSPIEFSPVPPAPPETPVPITATTAVETVPATTVAITAAESVPPTPPTTTAPPSTEPPTTVPTTPPTTVLTTVAAAGVVQPAVVPLLTPTITPACSAPASSDTAGNPITFDPANLVDTNPQTAWRCPGAAIGTHLEFTVPSATVIDQVALVAGYDAVDSVDGTDRFFQNRRPTTVSWICFGPDDAALAEVRQDIDPANRQVQTIDVSLAGCAVLDLRIDAVTSDFRDGKDFTAISEVVIRGHTQ